jgi:hypothetical protein
MRGLARAIRDGHGSSAVSLVGNKVAQPIQKTGGGRAKNAMAEAVRFELTEELPPRQFSRLIH